MADSFADHFSKISSNGNIEANSVPQRLKFEQDSLEILNNKDQNLVTYNEEFTLVELQNAISSGNSPSVGLDSISYVMLKHLRKMSLTILLSLFNSIWNAGHTPKAWGESVIIPILKAGKPVSDISSYRPKSLTSVLCKVMEKMISLRLNWFLETNNLLDINQSGFRKNRSTTDHISRLSDIINRAIYCRFSLYC